MFSPSLLGDQPTQGIFLSNDLGLGKVDVFTANSHQIRWMGMSTMAIDSRDMNFPRQIGGEFVSYHDPLAGSNYFDLLVVIGDY